MIFGLPVVLQALLGTLFTWLMTALGASLVYFLPVSISSARQKAILDGSLGFAAGVMLAASFWSLLAPAIELATERGGWGDRGEWAWIPSAIGIVAGAGFVYFTDRLLPDDADDVAKMIGLKGDALRKKKDSSEGDGEQSESGSGVGGPLTLRSRQVSTSAAIAMEEGSKRRSRKKKGEKRGTTPSPSSHSFDSSSTRPAASIGSASWRRIFLLVLAIVIHNMPEGLAVGVGFGAQSIQNSSSSSDSSLLSAFQSARMLAIGIGLQNFPEGLAVSLPLMRLGMSKHRAFFFGQLSGMVEPICGVLGAYAVQYISMLLPYALAFAAGAMIYVVADDLIAETCSIDVGGGSVVSSKLSSWGMIIGFIVMMALDVGLG